MLVAFIILSGFDPELREYGAYVLPLAWPLALAVVRSGPVVAAVAVGVAAVLSSGQARRHDTRPQAEVPASSPSPASSHIGGMEPAGK